MNRRGELESARELGENHLAFAGHARVAVRIEHGEGQAYRLAGMGGGRQCHDHAGRLSSAHVDGRRIGEHLAYAVAVTVDGDPETRRAFGEAVGQRPRRPGPVDDAHSFTRLQCLTGDGNAEQLLIQGLGSQDDSRRGGADFGETRGVATGHLGRAPAPEGRDLEVDHSARRNSQGSGFVHDGPLPSDAGGRCRSDVSFGL